MLHIQSNFSWNLQRNVCCVASCKKKFTYNTPFCNCNCCGASCKKRRTTLYFSQHCETSCLRVTSPLQRFLFLIVALRVARKIASCNMALTPFRNFQKTSLTRTFTHVCHYGSEEFYSTVVILFIDRGRVVNVCLRA